MQDFEEALGHLEFPKLLSHIARHTHSEVSAGEVLGLRPFGNRHEIETRFRNITDLRRLLEEGDALKISAFADVSPLLERVRPDGAVLDAHELAAFTPLMQIIDDIRTQLGPRDDVPSLKDLSAPLTGFPDILKILARSIDSEGAILDTASPELLDLRTGIRRLEARIRKRLEGVVQDHGVSIFLQDTFITQRSGRWVIPVRMDSKGMVDGVVHDVSKSGETAFVEPLAIIHLSNELENLIAEQKAEEIRVLRRISAQIRARADEIGAQAAIITRLDVLNGIALFADRLKMAVPIINETGEIAIFGGRHPLLMLTFARLAGDREVVPLDVRLGGDDRVMVITGSNAGGKTIAIKTIGLLVAMALTGIPVAASSSTSLPLVRRLLVDIGDEQSIEENLSTFSAHINHIASILGKSDGETLVLIDELGTGTDPDEGAAIACAVLSEISRTGALLFATTHLTDIKGYVHRTEGMVNASMEFDQETLTPLYRLRMGEPGKSHAIDIAQRYGLPERVIEAAKTFLGGRRAEFDDLIADLNFKRRQYEETLRDLAREKEEWEEKNRRLTETISVSERQGREILEKALREASDVIVNAKRQMHDLLDEARKRGREKIAEARREADRLLDETGARLREVQGEPDDILPLDKVIEGDVVFIRSFGHDAAVAEVDLRHGRVRVRSGGKEIEVPASDVAARRGGEVALRRRDEGISVPEKSAGHELMLVGLRVDDALSRLEPFLNDASLAGMREVRIIHGIGKGILMRAVRDHLHGHPLIARYRSGTTDEGGAGVTIATLV